MAKAKCPECGKMGECYYLGNSSITHNILDDYRFICPHCGFDKKETMDGGEVGWQENLTNCPFCHAEMLHHPGGMPMEEAEKLANAARARAAGFCPTCRQRLPEKKGDDLCPKCGKHKITCKYLGDQGAVDHCYTWEHTCPCGYHNEFTQFGCAGQEMANEVPPDGPGKSGGCPGPHN
ncbi:MAG: hypothetical protein ABII19_03300 [Patescibacteria group bacterium]